MKIRHAVAGAALISAALGLAPAATASTVSPQTVRQVCAEDLYVRATAQGVMIGLLKKGDNFDTQRTSPSGAYTFGHAYGQVHQDGWVQSSGLC
jgi:hypothetical protein